jgi:hypothetical protein
MRQCDRRASLIFGRNFAWAVVALALLAAGCGPMNVLPGAPGWPSEMNGRRLYNTPRAYVYASNDAAAGEADRLVESVAMAIAARGGIASKGVVIVTDLRDGPLGTDARSFYRAIRGEDYVSHCPGDKDEAFMGMSEEVEMLCRPEVVPVAAARAELKLPDEAGATWVVALPTRAMIDWGLVRYYAKSVRDQRELKWKAFAVATLPLEVALVAPLHHETEAVERAVVVFEQIANRQAGWSETGRRERVYEYRNRVDVERTWYMPVTWFPPL